MSFHGEVGGFAARPGADMLTAFCPMATLLNVFARVTDTWRGQFSGSIGHCLMRVRDEIVRLIVGILYGWRSAIRIIKLPSLIARANQFARRSAQRDGASSIAIAPSGRVVEESELVTSATWGPHSWQRCRWRGRGVIVGADKADVFSEIRHGRSPIGRGRSITAFSMRTVEFGIEVTHY